MGLFHFKLLTISCHDTAFKKPSLENHFWKEVVPGTSKHWS